MKIKYSINKFLIVFCLALMTNAVRADISAQYYDQNNQSGQYFTGNVINRVDANIDFRWGGGSPLAGIGRDNFSIRWTGELEVPSDGSYQFQTRSDDGVRLWVNGNLIVNNWTNHGPTNNTSGALALLSGQRYPIVMEFYERGGGAEARLRWSGPGIGGFPAIPAANLFPETSEPTLVNAQFNCARDSISLLFSESVNEASAENIANYTVDKGVVIVSAVLASDFKTVVLTTQRQLGAFNYTLGVDNVTDLVGNAIAPNSQIAAGLSASGLQATFYDQNGQSRQYFTGNTVVQTVTQVNNDWGLAAPVAGIGQDEFSVRWHGSLEIPTSGNYTFRTRSDDGVRLWIDNSLVIDNWTDHGARYDSSAELAFNVGDIVDVRMEFYEHGGHAVAMLQWSGPGISMQTIAPQYFVTQCTITPAAQWKMDEAFWNGTVGEVIDSSNGFNGQSFNGANTTGTACHYGIFDGSNDYVQVPHNDALNGLDGLTYMGWIRADSWTGVDQMMAKSVHGGGSGRAQMGIFSERGVLKVRAETQGGRREITAPLPLVAGDWNHIASVFDGETLTLYVDGVIQTSTSFNPTSLKQTIDPLNISKRGGTDTYYFHGLMDDLRVYTQALSQQEIADVIGSTSVCALSPGLHHFKISAGSATASTCVEKQITVQACANADCSQTATAYIGDVNISTSSNHGDWSKSSALGALNPALDNDDDGAVSYSFDGGDNGLIVLNLGNQHADNLTVMVSDPALVISNTSSAIQFSDNVFVITSPAENLEIAGRPKILTASLWKRDNVTGNCGIATAYDGQKSLKAWLVRDAGDPGGIAPSINAVSLVDTPASRAINFNFSLGVSTFDLLSTDVGKYTLYLRDDTGLFAQGNNIDSDAFSLTMRPFGFDVQAIGNDPGNSNNGTDGDDVFKIAGDPFTVTARAVLWAQADDSDNDGIPDGHNNNDATDNVILSDNVSAPAFGQEAVGEVVSLSFNRVAPAPPSGVDGLFSGSTISSFISGSGSTVNRRYSEVGIIEITATLLDDDYLASGEAVWGASSYVGRFYPANFVLSQGSLTNRTDSDTQGACSSPFTFLDEELTLKFDLTAMNRAGNVTQNYSGDFAKLNGVILLGDVSGRLQSTLNLVASDGVQAYTVADRLGGGSVAAIDFVNGFADDQSIAVAMKRNVAVTPELPISGLEFAINPIDSDGVESNGAYSAPVSGGPQNFSLLGNADLYFGRLLIENAYGSELKPLPMWAHTEYCTAVNGVQCSQWTDLSRSVASDECSKFLVLDTGAPLDTAITSCWDTGITYSACTVVPAVRQEVQFKNFDNIFMKRGGGGWLLNYTGAASSAAVQVPVLGAGQTVENYHPYLLLQQGEASFGTYRGHDRIIYWRELVE